MDKRCTNVAGLLCTVAKQYRAIPYRNVFINHKRAPFYSHTGTQQAQPTRLLVHLALAPLASGLAMLTVASQSVEARLVYGC